MNIKAVLFTDCRACPFHQTDPDEPEEYWGYVVCLHEKWPHDDKRLVVFRDGSVPIPDDCPLTSGFNFFDVTE